MSDAPSIELDFSRKYDHQHAQQYLNKHRTGLFRKLSHKREEQLARQALIQAGSPACVLDLPCGAGRFWPLLAEHPGRLVLAADNSADMLTMARSAQPAHLVERIHTFQTSAFDIKLNDNAVDCLFCMRLLHHIEHREHRQLLLRELHRVTRDTVIISLWVDGNYKAWKRKRLEKRRLEKNKSENNKNRFVFKKTEVEAEFREAGFKIIDYQDFLPTYAMWRIYTLHKETQT